MSTTAASRATQDLIHGAQGLVRMLALRAFRRHGRKFELDDLISFGQVGLAQAAQAYNPETGGQFSTYAYYRIRGAIFDGVEKMGWGSRSAHRRARMLRRMTQAVEADAAVQAAEPAADLPAREEAHWLSNITQQLVVVSFATLEVSGAPAENIAESDDENPEDLAAAREVHSRLRVLVEELPEEPRRLIEGMYFQGQTLQEAADDLGISKSWASRLHGRALTRLAGLLRQIGVDASAAAN